MICEFPVERSMWHKTFTEIGKDFDIDYTGYYSIDLLDHNVIDANEVLDADWVFVYAANYYHEGVKAIWDWVELPKFVQKFVMPPTKMAVLYDWTEFEMCGESYPKGMFESMNISDVVFNGNQYGTWFPYINKPHHYIVEPKLMIDFTIPKKDGGNIAVFRHTPANSSAYHTLQNVTAPIGVWNTYFHSGWSSAPPLDDKVLEDTFSDPVWNLPWKEYLDKLSTCYIGIDDNINYYGWSRFGYEAAMMGVPVIGSQRTASNTYFYPELVTEHKDYKKQQRLIKKLYGDPDYTYELAVKGNKRMREHLNPHTCIRRMVDVLNGI